MTDLLQMAVLSCVAIAAGLISPFLVLKKLTMFANSLSHTILLGIALAFLATHTALFNTTTLLIGALFAAFLTALFTGGLVHLFRLQEDASVGLVFTALFALGIAVVTFFMRDVHLGLEAVMGSADILQFSDFTFSFSLALFNLAFILFFYKQFQIVSFDGNLAQILKMRPRLFHCLLLGLSSLTCVAAFRAVGVLLVLSFLVGPFLTARLFFHRLPPLLIATPLIGVFCSAAGVLLTRLCLDIYGIALSTAGVVSTLIGLTYLFSKWFLSAKLALCEKKLRS